MKSKKPLVSIIIPTKNSEGSIGICLKSVKEQSYPNIEAIVVDDRSKDDTTKIAERCGAKVLIHSGTRTVARNYGAKFANGNYVLHIDSDMELTPKVVEECVNRCEGNEDNGVDAVIIPEKSVGEGFWVKCRALERSTRFGNEFLEAPRFIRKSAFQAIGGYDEGLVMGEDWDVHIRLKEASYSVSRINAFIKHHEGRLSLWTLIRKKYYYGKTLDRYVKKHPGIAKKQVMLFKTCYLRNWKKLIRDPVHTTGFIFMKFLEFSVGGLGFMRSKIKGRAKL